VDGNILLSSLGVRVTEPTPGRLASFSARIDSCGRKSALCGKLFFFAWNGGGRVVPTHINAVYQPRIAYVVAWHRVRELGTGLRTAYVDMVP
jgi:hypothetical protein